jgi:hypothetical protein
VTDDSLQGRMRRLTERAVEMADVCLFVIDGAGRRDAHGRVFADILRKKNARVFLAANKAEGGLPMAARWTPGRWALASRSGSRPNMARGWTISTTMLKPLEG